MSVKRCLQAVGRREDTDDEIWRKEEKTKDVLWLRCRRVHVCVCVCVAADHRKTIDNTHIKAMGDDDGGGRAIAADGGGNGLLCVLLYGTGVMNACVCVCVCVAVETTIKPDQLNRKTCANDTKTAKRPAPHHFVKA